MLKKSFSDLKKQLLKIFFGKFFVGEKKHNSNVKLS